MKILITESQNKKAALAWMNKNFSPDQLEIVISPKYPDSIFYKKNGVIVIEENKNDKYFWFDYDEIWAFIKSFFSMETKEVKDILKVWLEDTFKVNGFRAGVTVVFDRIQLEEASN